MGDEPLKYKEEPIMAKTGLEIINNSSDSNGAAGRVFTLDTDLGSANATFNIPANFFMKNTGKSFRIGQVKGSGALAGYCEFGNGAVGRQGGFE